MSTLHQDLERGPEMTQAGSMPMSMSMGSGEPTRPYPPRREHTMSPSQMSRTLSQHQSAIILDNPILSAFRYHVGIHNDPSLAAHPTQDPSQNRDSVVPRSMGDLVTTIAHAVIPAQQANNGFARPAPNLGIYQRVIAAEKKYHHEYKVFSFLINGALGLQIIFAAALTALGAGNGPNQAVTAFGALNTVLAGFLTFLKGSGLPNRLKYYENEWSKLREYIEYRERDLASDVHRGKVNWEDLAEEIAIIENKYNTVRKDVEANTPDSYVSMSNAIKSLNSGGNHNNGHNAGLSKLSQPIGMAEEHARRMGNNVNDRVLSRISEVEQRASKGWGDVEKQTTVQVREISDNVHGQVRDTGKMVETRMNNTQQSIEDGMRRTQNNVETRFNDAHNSAQMTYNNAQNAAQTHYDNAQNTAQTHYNNAQNAVQSRVYETQDAMQQRVNATQQQFAESQHQAESKAREIEHKIASVAESAAEKVLQFTKHRHQ